MTTISPSRALRLAHRGISSVSNVPPLDHCPESTSALLPTVEWGLAATDLAHRPPVSRHRRGRHRRSSLRRLVEASGWYAGVSFGMFADAHRTDPFAATDGETHGPARPAGDRPPVLGDD